MMFDGFWYRFEVRRYAAADEFGDYSHSYAQGDWMKFCVIKETPRGVWLCQVPRGNEDPDCCRGRATLMRIFVNGMTAKQYAVPTRELALRDARIRLERRISGHEARAYRDRRALKIVTSEDHALMEAAE